jgi:hypothetical protein
VIQGELLPCLGPNRQPVGQHTVDDTLAQHEVAVSILSMLIWQVSNIMNLHCAQVDADEQTVKTAYKRLALKWYAGVVHHMVSSFWYSCSTSMHTRENVALLPPCYHRRQSIRANMRCRHPDKNPGNEDAASEQFKRVFAAHQRMLRETDDSEEEDDFNEDDYEAAMEEALAFFTFMWGPSNPDCKCVICKLRMW